MQHDPLIGKQLGAYLIQVKIGEGGMARVYKAYHARLRRDVAIKVILPQVADASGFRERFEREAQLVARLEHRNIVAVYDFGEDGNLTYLIMQYVGGGTLRDQLRQHGHLEPHRATQYIIQIARALHHAHQRGIVHRDVKPQNMLVSSSDPNEILLSDFGIAKIFDSTQEETITYAPENIGEQGGQGRHAAELTNIGQMVGTAEYMAPEQINRQPVDARTDVYALGIVLFQMLTGQIPFSSTTVQGLLFQHVYTPPKPVREVNPTVPEALERIISHALAKNPDQRYQSAAAMAQALEATLTARQTFTPPIDNSTPYERTSSVTPSYTPSNPSVPPQSSFHEQAGQQPPPNASYSHYSNYGMMPLTAPSVPSSTHQPSRPASPVPRSTDVAPILSRSRRKIQVSTIMMVVIALIAIALLVMKFVPLPTTGSGAGSNCTASFTENFHDNPCNWFVGTNNHLTASRSNNTYLLQVGNANETYFPNPSSVATLPDAYTFATQVTQNAGATSVFYGLAFRFTGDNNSVSCYAFAIDGKGDYEVLKYAANQPRATILWQGTSQAIHAQQSNALQVAVHGSNFSFKINGNTVPVGANHGTTMADTSYLSGKVALLVAGPNTSFT
ncbi:MAG: protein kinase, partial [Chloroflexota bacterium]|nr:protein kinase [Chloroflexota bacterium]